MSDRVVLNGHFRLVITHPLRRLLNQLVQQRNPKPSQREEGAAILSELIKHPYVLNDPWSAAEERYSMERGRCCQEMLAGLEIRLVRGEVRYEGVEDATGTPHLTVAHIKDHGLRLLDLSADWLLLAVDRHPQGGSGLVRRQHWLYDKHRRVLHLLQAETVHSVKNPKMMVKSGEEPWQEVNDSLERDFFRLIELRLGPESIEAVKWTRFPAECLAHPDQEVLSKCAAISGFDYISQEKGRREQLEAKWLKKYGPRKNQPAVLPAISARGIEIVYAE